MNLLDETDFKATVRGFAVTADFDDCRSKEDSHDSNVYVERITLDATGQDILGIVNDDFHDELRTLWILWKRKSNSAANEDSRREKSAA